MKRLSLVLIAAAGLSCGHVCAQAVPEHTHAKAELGLSCAETCAPGVCSSSFDVGAQKLIDCDSGEHRFALCVCQAPKQ